MFLLREQEFNEAEYRAFLNEKCPCGHTHFQHNGDWEDCTSPGCDCPEFGVDPLTREPEPREVNVGDGPGGFRIYE